MSRRASPYADALKQERAPKAMDEIERARRSVAAASEGQGRGPLVVAIVAGLALGLGLAGFQSAPPALRLQAYDMFGIGAPRTCDEAREVGIGRQSRGDRYYFAHLDYDKDGISCAPSPNGGWR